jgi:HD-like signal output (HDOD) protein
MMEFCDGVGDVAGAIEGLLRKMGVSSETIFPRGFFFDLGVVIRPWSDEFFPSSESSLKSTKVSCDSEDSVVSES